MNNDREYQLFEKYKECITNPASDPTFYSYYQDAKSKIINMIEKDFSLHRYDDNENYQKMKDFIADRYAKLYAFASLLSTKETSFSNLPEFQIDSLFDSFGFTFHKNLSYDDKRIIAQNIVKLIQSKGTNIVQDVLQILMKYTEIKITDIDLIKDSNGIWNLISTKAGTRIRVSEVNDNHWLTDLSTVNEPYQKRTPFFTFTSTRNSLEDLTQLILFINILVRDELFNYVTNGSFSSNIFVEPLQTSLSFTEIWLFTIILYRTYILLSSNNQTQLNPSPQSIVVYDGDFVVTDEFKTNLFNSLNQITNPDLRDLTYQFFMQYYDDLENITLSEFDAYLASTWQDYFVLNENVRNTMIASAYFFMLIVKYRNKVFYIEDLWNQLTRLPYDYIEKYVSCIEDPTKGLLYVFYDYFVKNYDDSSFIVENIIKNPDGQLAIINPQLITFKDRIVDSFNNEEVSKDDIRKLLIYFVLLIRNYLFEKLNIQFPIDIYFGGLLSYYDKNVIDITIDEIKPIYARSLFGTSVNKFLIDNPLLDSALILSQIEKVWLLQKLYDTEEVFDKIEKTTISMIFADIIGGASAYYKFLDPTFIAYIFRRHGEIIVNSCYDVSQNISNYKLLKEYWTCCDDDLGVDQTQYCLCNANYAIQSDKSIMYWNDNNAIYNDDMYYFGQIPLTAVSKFVVAHQDCLTDKIHSPLTISILRNYYNMQGLKSYGYLDPTTNTLYANKQWDYYISPTLEYLENQKVFFNQEIEFWVFAALNATFYPAYSVLDIVNDLVNNPYIAMVISTYDLVRDYLYQKIYDDTIVYNDILDIHSTWMLIWNASNPNSLWNNPDFVYTPTLAYLWGGYTPYDFSTQTPSNI